MLRTDPNYAVNLYNVLHKVEDRSPYNLLRTFGLSELASSYLPNRIDFSHSQLVDRGRLNDLGSHFQRLFGDRVDVANATEGLSFLRTDKASPYLDLITDLGGAESGLRVRFTEKGRYSSSSFRYGRPIDPEAISWSSEPNPGKRLWTNFQAIKRSQAPKGYSKYGGAVISGIEGTQGEFSKLFQPYLAEVAGENVRNVGRKASRMGFELLERPQRLLADVGLGLRNRSYNTLAHIPFMGGASKGLINEVLTKRALPFYLLAGVGLPFADYLLGHAPSGLAIDIWQKADVSRAKLTDNTPLRGVTDFYENVIPGPQYGPLALPVGLAFAGGLYHYSKVARGLYESPQARKAASRILAEPGEEALLKFFNKGSPVAKGLLAGLALMLPFVPGMLGSRQTADELQSIYSGETPVAVRSGRWWDMGSTPWEGSRITAWRPHWSVLWRTQAEKVSLYGSEEEYWNNHPILHPFNYLADPYALEEKNYEDRPYPVTSPAFSNVPLIGPILAATLGKLVKPPVRMHEGEWNDIDDYSLFSTRLEPRGPDALPPPIPTEEFSLGSSLKQEATIFADFIGLPGFIGKTIWDDIFSFNNLGREINLEGSRQMDSWSRRYYEREMGAGLVPNASGSGGIFGITEPYRRFIQPEKGLADANEIPNKMPSWIPGDDYFMNFRVGDPYAKINDGFARLPGAGYGALHPEVGELEPEDYPDINRMEILADVAPYSREYQTYKSRVARQAAYDTDLSIRYSQIVDRVNQTKKSVIRTEERRFSEEVESAEGTVKRITPIGLEIEEFPGRIFSLSSVGISAADMSAAALAQNNNLTRSQVNAEVERRERDLASYLTESLSPGTSVQLTVQKGALQHSLNIQAVVRANGDNLNQELIDRGLGVFRKDLGGAEQQAMFSTLGRTLGSLSESLSFTGDESAYNPLRYIPQPFNSKLWQNREVLSQYREQEVIGARMRRWQRPVQDFIAPYTRGLVRRLTGETIIPEEVSARRDLNTMADMLKYLRAQNLAIINPDSRGKYTSQASRTAIGVNLFAAPSYVGSTLGDREAHYFNRFLSEVDPKKRKQILELVPAEMGRALSAQWAAQDTQIAYADGLDISPVGEGGRLYTKEDLDDYKKANTALDYGNYVRSREIAEFFSSRNLNIPDPDSALWNPYLDYEDVKLKIIQNEGYDAHDFNMFDDRAALLWRKPYVDGAVRELTTGNRRSGEDLRRVVEQVMLANKDRDPSVSVTGHSASVNRTSVKIDVDVDEREQFLQDVRRNPEKYN